MTIYRNTNPSFGDTTVTFTGSDVQDIIDNLCAGGNAADMAEQMGCSVVDARAMIADEFRAALEIVEGVRL
jgi:hypothetical protein